MFINLIIGYFACIINIKLIYNNNYLFICFTFGFLFVNKFVVTGDGYNFNSKQTMYVLDIL